jgi:hypothetical protein
MCIKQNLYEKNINIRWWWFLDRWKKLQWDYDESVIYDSRKLKEYKIKKIT